MNMYYKYTEQRVFFFGGELFYFKKTFNEIFQYLEGFNNLFKKLLIKRFELVFYCFKKNKTNLLNHEEVTNKVIIKPLNIILSQVNSVNTKIGELQKLNIIRIYLIKSYKGRCHYMGKPVRGQRTWSNSWNSFKINKILRNFVMITKKYLKKNQKEKKQNYKIIQKKYGNKKKKKKNKIIVKEWY